MVYTTLNESTIIETNRLRHAWHCMYNTFTEIRYKLTADVNVVGIMVIKHYFEHLHNSHACKVTKNTLQYIRHKLKISCIYSMCVCT